MCEEHFIDVEETNASAMFREMNLHRCMRNASLSVDEASEILKSSTLTFVILLSLILTNKTNKFEQ